MSYRYLGYREHYDYQVGFTSARMDAANRWPGKSAAWYRGFDDGIRSMRYG